MEPITDIRSNIRVIVMFLEDESPRVDRLSSFNPSDATQKFLKKCGGWEDKRSTEEIIAEIYAARSYSTRCNDIFKEQK